MFYLDTCILYFPIVFRNTTTQIQNTTAWSGKATLGFKVTGTGSSDFYGGIQLTRQGSSGYNSQLEFQTSIYNNNLRTVMTLNSAGSLHLDGTVYANGVIGLNSGGFAIGSIASYNRIDFQSGTFRTLKADGSVAPLQVGDLTASSLTTSNANFTGNKVTFNGGEILADDGSAHYVKGGSALYLYRASADLAMSILSTGIRSHKDLTVARTEYDGDIKLGNTTYYSTIKQRASSTGKLEINQEGGTSTSKGIHFQINGTDAVTINHDRTLTVNKKLYANERLRILQLNAGTGTNSLMIANDGDVYTRELGNDIIVDNLGRNWICKVF